MMKLTGQEILTLRNLVYLDLVIVGYAAALPVEHRGTAPRRKEHLEELLNKLDTELELVRQQLREKQSSPET